MDDFLSSRRMTWAGLSILDAAILVFSIIAAAWIRFNPTLFALELDQFLDHPGFFAYAVIIQFVLATTFDLYRVESWRSREVLLVRIAALALTLPIALALGAYLVMPWKFGRGILVLTLTLSLTLQMLLRFVWLAFSKRAPAQTAVVIGDGPIVGALLEEIEHRPSAPFRIIRHIPSPKSAQTKKPRSRDLAKADMVIVASLTHNPTVDQLAALNFQGTAVIDAAGAYAALTGRIPVLQVDSRWFIASGDFSSLATTPFHQAQRLIDVLAATFLLIATLPISILSALTILVTSGSPVLFKQRRLGRFGKPFTLLKFRTMKDESDRNGPTFTQKDDERILPMGRLMRRWRIDELPQLLNVLRGDMSLVGPRPERPGVAETLAREIPFYAYRYSVRPGLTGWAQVNLPYCSDTEDHLIKLEFDLYFLRHYGAAMYFMVLLRTLGALIFRPGR